MTSAFRLISDIVITYTTSLRAPGRPPGHAQSVAVRLRSLRLPGLRAAGQATSGMPDADVAWPAARSAALWAFCRRQNAPEGKTPQNIFWSQHETSLRQTRPGSRHTIFNR